MSNSVTKILLSSYCMKNDSPEFHEYCTHSRETNAFRREGQAVTNERLTRNRNRSVWASFFYWIKPRESAVAIAWTRLRAPSFRMAFCM